MRSLSAIIVILFLIAGTSCSRRNKDIDKSGIIPEKDIESILKEVYLADGLLYLSSVYQWYSKTDTVPAYINIIRQHGYTKTDMDKSMRYYYIKNPKILVKIYDKILSEFSETESLLNKESLSEQKDQNNLWTGKINYSIPFADNTIPGPFDITLDNPGQYTLTFSLTVFSNDQSVNPRISIYYIPADSITDNNKTTLKTVPYLKDDRTHQYDFNIEVMPNKPVHLKGYLFCYDNLPGEWEKHVNVEDISITKIR
jgi:hypothetical protein